MFTEMVIKSGPPNSPSRFDWALTIALFIATNMALMSVSGLNISPDGREYISASQSFLNGTYFSNEFTLRRTPLYPSLLAITAASLGHFPQSVLILHSFLLLGACACCVFAFIPFLKPWATLSAVLLGTFLAGSSYFWVLSEWTGVCMLLAVFGLLSRPKERITPKILLVASMLNVLLTLLKPSLGPVSILLLVYTQLQASSLSRRTRGSIVLASIAPLLLVFAINQKRIGAPVLTPYGGFSLFGLASLIGHAEPQNGDSPQLRAFIEFVNEHKIPQIQDEADYFEKIGDWYDNNAFDRNLWKVAEKYRQDQNWRWEEFNSACKVYAGRTIFNFPGRYLEYVLFGQKILGSNLELLIAGLLTALFLRKKPELEPAGHGLLILLCAHLVHTVFTAAMIATLPRYYVMTLAPIGAATILGLSILLLSRLRALRES